MVGKSENPPENGALVLDQIRRFLVRFAKFPTPAMADVVTLWIAHTYAVGADQRLAFDTTPRLAVVSDGPASGKTRVLDLVKALGRNCTMVVDPTPATLATGISEKNVTSLIDEIDVLFGAGGAKSVLRSILNSGYKRGAVWQRTRGGDAHIFAPVALAGMGAKFENSEALSALKTRSIIIRMKPSKGKIESYRPREHDITARVLAQELGRWVGRNVNQITEDWPELPAGVEDRAAEVWEPLFMVANVAGGHWPEKIREACEQIALHGNQEPDEPSLTETLFSDLRTVFAGSDKLSTVRIVDGLFSLPDSPWSKLWPNPAGAPRELAALLAPYNIVPTKVRDGRQSLRGYCAESFTTQWAELPPPAIELD